MSTTNDTIVVKDRYGEDITHTGASAIRVKTLDGNTKDFIDSNLIPDPVGRDIQLDFTEGDMEVNPEEGTVFSNVTIRQPENLVSENIAEGTIIAGIKGSHKGGGGGGRDESKPIRFYNAYGDVVYGFTRAEIQTLTELPAGPSLSGHTFDKWTHTLDELKSEMYFADVGPTYKYAGTPATVLIVEVPSTKKLSISLYIEIGVGIGIAWGDGSAETIAQTSSYQSKTLSHTYTAEGQYVVSIRNTSNTYNYNVNLGYGSGSYTYNMGSLSLGNSSVSLATSAISDYIISIIQGADSHLAYPKYAHTHCRLQFVSMYKACDSIGRQYLNCLSLKLIAGKRCFGTTSNQFFNTSSLSRFGVLSSAGSIGANSFKYCYALKEVIYGKNAIADVNMNSKWTMLMTSETPPSVTASSPKWGTYPIYVPDSAVDAYKAAAGWVNVAAYILPASTYPDK